MPTDSSAPLAVRERAALADLLDELGPAAPTCCEGWDTAHLAAHLVVRDRRPDALPGYALEALPAGRGLRERAGRLEDRLRAAAPYPEVVAAVRSGPPVWSPMGWPVLGRLLNTAEYAIHHEDARRARPGWSPRALSRADRDQLWPAATMFARRAARPRTGTLVLRRSDVPGAELRLGGWEPGTAVEGDPMELLLWAAGRRGVARVRTVPA